MKWGKVLLGGLLGAVALNIADFVMHGLMLAGEYREYAVFSQEQANPLLFFVVALCISLAGALLFAKTRGSWPAGVGGGIRFGFFAGLVTMFQPLYNTIVIEGFPYHLGWCWGGVNVIGMMILGAVLGAVIKS